MEIKRPHSLGRFLNFATTATNALCNHLLAQHGLTLQQWVVLSALWQSDGLSVSEIAEYTASEGPAASRIIDRMVEKGLVARKPDPADRRAVKINLTPRSSELRHLQGFFNDLNALLLDGLTDEEAERIFDLLQRITHNAIHARKADG